METKVVRLHISTYDRLDAVREKRQTFSQAIDELLNVYETVKRALAPHQTEITEKEVKP